MDQLNLKIRLAQAEERTEQDRCASAAATLQSPHGIEPA
jgi:hypothetical protein